MTFKAYIFISLFLMLIAFNAPAGAEIIKGTPDDDDIVGTPEADTISGLAGNDRLRGRGGDDRLFGGPGGDLLIGDDGNDRLHAGPGGSASQILNGGNGDDILFGGDSPLRDQLRGDNGNDILVGRAGPDELTGGLGRDQLTGGNGRDQFFFGGGDVYDSGVGRGNRDRITDWEEGEEIGVVVIDADKTTPENEDFIFVGRIDPQDVLATGEIGFIETGGVTILRANTDADPAQDFEIQLGGVNLGLTADDIKGANP